MSISTASVISTLPCWSTAALMSERYRLHLVTLRHQRHWIFTLMYSLRRRQKRVKQSPPHLTSERKKHRWNLVLIWCLFIWKHAEIWWNIWKRKAQKTLILRCFWQYLITSKNASNGFESRFPLHTCGAWFAHRSFFAQTSGADPFTFPLPKSFKPVD